MISLDLYSSKGKKTLFKLFFLFFILEATIGGSGGLIQLGGVTLRKIDFTIALIIYCIVAFHIRRIPKNIALILGAFIVTISIPLILGLINYGSNPKVMENLLMQSFFLLLPFYSLFISNEEDVSRVVSILKFSSLVIAIVFLAVIILMSVGVLDFLTLYASITDSQEFMGRGNDLFWYKGFLYLCLGLFFIDIENGIFLKRFKQIILLIAIYFTFTRGFILALLASIFVHQLFFKSFLKSLIIVCFSVIMVVSFNQYYTANSFDRGESDEIRVTQYHQVMSALDPVSIIIGHGFGEGVPIRDNHMEINYLEIFHKQGLLGITFWFFILGYIVLLYHNCKKLGNEKKARPFLLATLFVFIQSATNPFLTNSIGLNMIMISIVSLNVYLNVARAKLADQHILLPAVSN